MCHISVHLKKLTKVGESLCSYFLILKMEEDIQHFLCIMLYYFKKDNNATEIKKKKICVVYREGAMTDGKCPKWFV